MKYHDRHQFKGLNTYDTMTEFERSQFYQRATEQGLTPDDLIKRFAVTLLVRGWSCPGGPKHEGWRSPQGDIMNFSEACNTEDLVGDVARELGVIEK